MPYNVVKSVFFLSEWSEKSIMVSYLVQITILSDIMIPLSFGQYDDFNRYVNKILFKKKNNFFFYFTNILHFCFI
jgi:hypothetical protein